MSQIDYPIKTDSVVLQKDHHAVLSFELDSSTTKKANGQKEFFSPKGTREFDESTLCR